MTDLHKQVTQHPRQRCYFCGSEGPIETHHIVPRRYDGSDDEVNLVDLCPNCHQRLESLYNKRFYQELDVDDSIDVVDANSDTSISQRQRMQSIKNLIDDIGADFEKGAPIEEVLDRVGETGISPSDAEDELEDLRGKGEVYEPAQGYLRTT